MRTRMTNGSAGIVDAFPTRAPENTLRSAGCWEALGGVFAMREGGRVDNLRILLLDDVRTTGATVDACLTRSTRSRRQAGSGPDDCLGRPSAKLLRRTHP